MEQDQLPEEAIAARIHWIRGHKVMLDSDLAMLYGGRTKRLNDQVKGDPARSREDIMFFHSDEEWNALRSQNATSSGRGGRRYPPMAFTEHVVLMLSSVLNREQAIAVYIKIMRVFVRFSRVSLNDLELRLRLERVEGRTDRGEAALHELFDAVEQLMERPCSDRRRIGYMGGDAL